MDYFAVAIAYLNVSLSFLEYHFINIIPCRIFALLFMIITMTQLHIVMKHSIYVRDFKGTFIYWIHMQIQYLMVFSFLNDIHII